MKGAILVGPEAGLMAKARASLAERFDLRGGDADWLQVADDGGRLFSLYPSSADLDWEWRDGVSTARCTLPEGWHAMHGYNIECRWVDLFVEVVHAITVTVDGPWYVVDGDGVLWLAADPELSGLRL